MKKKTIKIPLGQIPEEVRKPASDAIKCYVVALVHNDDLAGSGTLTVCEDKLGILTARHVAHDCSPQFDFSAGSTDKLGLGIDDSSHAFELEMRYLIPHEVPGYASVEFGPDLLFIEILSSPKLDTLKAKKSFWNLTLNPKERAATAYDEINCIWAISGYPYQLRGEYEPSRGFEQVLEFRGIGGFTGVENIFEKDEYDYFEVAATYPAADGVPTCFRGVSGGGLWRIPISLEKEDSPLTSLKTGNPLLAGVPFCQGPLQNQRRGIRCHGPKSIYQKLPSIIKSG